MKKPLTPKAIILNVDSAIKIEVKNKFTSSSTVVN